MYRFKNWTKKRVSLAVATALLLSFGALLGLRSGQAQTTPTSTPVCNSSQNPLATVAGGTPFQHSFPLSFAANDMVAVTSLTLPAGQRLLIKDVTGHISGPRDEVYLLEITTFEPSVVGVRHFFPTDQQVIPGMDFVGQRRTVFHHEVNLVSQKDQNNFGLDLAVRIERQGNQLGDRTSATITISGYLEPSSLACSAPTPNPGF